MIATRHAACVVHLPKAPGYNCCGKSYRYQVRRIYRLLRVVDSLSPKVHLLFVQTRQRMSEVRHALDVGVATVLRGSHLLRWDVLILRDAKSAVQAALTHVMNCSVKRSFFRHVKLPLPASETLLVSTLEPLVLIVLLDPPSQLELRACPYLRPSR